jgi:hypothetical protein
MPGIDFQAILTPDSAEEQTLGHCRTGVRAPDLVLPVSRSVVVKRWTVSIEDRFHHLKLGVGRVKLPDKLDDLNRRT